MPQGSILTRGCWCHESPVRVSLQHALRCWLRVVYQVTCPVHRLGPLLDSLADGECLFPGITASRALATLRMILKALSVDCADDYRTHDLRRGHALDLQLSGEPLWVILAAGDWRSPAFLAYLDKHQLEADLVMQAHLADSDVDPEA